MKTIDRAKATMRNDSQEFRNDFMVGHGKGHARDKLTRQRPSARRILTKPDLTDLYANNSIVQNIIDIPPEDMTRAGWTLKIEDQKLKAAYESKLRQLKAKDTFKSMFGFDRLYGDGFISLGLVQKRNYQHKDPVKLENLKSMPYINAFSSIKVNNFIVNEDVFDPGYGRVEYFTVNRRMPVGEIERFAQHQTQEIVHHSRLLHQQTRRFEDEHEGTPLLESLYDIVTVMDTSLWSIGQILHDFAFKIYKSKDAEDLNKEDKRELAGIMDFMFRSEALAIIGIDEELRKETTSVAGVSELLEFVWDYLSGAVRMPKTVLKGQEAGTLTGAQYDVMNYYSRITAMQEMYLRPHLEYLIRLLMWCEDECGGRHDPDKIEWSIEFNPLWTVDSETDAKIRKLTAETDAINIQNGVVNAEEVREARFGRFGVTDTSKFNADSADEDINKIAEEVYKAYKQNRSQSI